jgi:Zn-dependent M16 (insulinase) family peptidase
MSKEALAVLGSKYKDFTVTKHLPLSELQSTLVELVHNPSGARVIHIANSDPENLFCLSLKTLPDSSNGVAHILEHTVLCGSKKFPVKDPFFAMTRRSLNTFMNAMTGQDFTCYPASSQVEKDFYNLLEVYIDAVFYPELKRLSFLQEGHRLEFSEPKNPKSPLHFQGIVYNEMKGSLSSSDNRLWNAIFKHLCSDLPYAHNTGGDPKEIPSLSFEELTEFHKNFYNPSRCLFFFYGNLPLSKHLDFLEEKVLSGAPKLTPLPPLPRQKRFKAPILREDTYPIQESEGLKKKAILSFTWLTAPVTHPGEVLALSLLDCLLMDNDASPLRHALLKSKLCTQTSSYLDIEMSEVPWIIICKGCEPEDREPLRKLLFKTLKEIASSGFSKEAIEASLHQLEFDRTEINTDEGPFGLTLFMRAALVTQHGSDAENGLLIHTLFKELREKIENPEYLPNLIRYHLIDNPHFLAHTFAADKGLGEKEAEEEKKRLEAIQSRLSEKEAVKIIADSEALALYQEKTEHQSLDCLPKVSLGDISTHGRDLSLEEAKSAKMSIFHHPCFTNQILYADLVFDLPNIPFADLPLSSLLVRFLTEVGCGGQSYEKTLHDSQAYTGGLNASLSLHVNHSDPDRCFPSLSIKGKALARNSSKLFDLFAKLIASPDFSDAKRIKELLSQHATSLQNGVSKNALKYATQISLSPFSSASTIYNEWNGIPYYAAVMKWAKNPDALIEELARLKSQILNVGTPALILSCSQEEYDALKGADFYGLGEKIGGKSYEKWKGNYPLSVAPPQARFISAPVAFTAMGTRTASYTDPASPLLLLSTELLQNVILHNEIREKGGAYGSGASYAASTGNFYFYSYRDPHLAKTLATFEKAMEKIAEKKFTEENLEEAKFGVFQSIDAPIAPGSRAMTAYSWKRSGRTPQMRDAFRSKLLGATSTEVAKAVETFLLPKKKILVSFLGEALFEKEKEKLKQPLTVFPLES